MKKNLSYRNLMRDASDRYALNPHRMFPLGDTNIQKERRKESFNERTLVAGGFMLARHLKESARMIVGVHVTPRSQSNLVHGTKTG
jgi:hypothetical protein